MRVRLFQKRSEGMFYRETHLPGVGRDRAALDTYDRDEAERLGKALLAALLTGRSRSVEAPEQPVRLGELWDRYRTECASFLDNKPVTKRDAAYRAPVLLGYFGRGRDVRTLSALDVAQYVQARRAGGIRYADDRPSGRASPKVTQPVRQRSVHMDLVLLRAMLRWACTVPAGGRVDGARWVARNPLDGMRFAREKNPARPVASWDRFVATRTALANLAANALTAGERERWVRLDLALVLAEATGRRRGAIVALSWEDVDFAAGTIRWRAEYDKKGVESVVPVPPALLEELMRLRKALGALKGRLFPSAKDPSRPLPADMLTQWLRAAEAKANLPKLGQGLWHPYRRKWASERMHLPLKAVADAGGWKDVSTLLTCYQQSDEATLLAVMNEPKKRRESRRADLKAWQDVPNSTTGAAGDEESRTG